MENHRFFLKYVFLKMGTSPKSSFFQRLARGLRPNDRVAQRGIQQGSTTGEQNGKQQRKMKSEKNIFIFFNLFNCFEICLYINRREKWKITDFCDFFFLKIGASPKSSFFKMRYEAFYRDDGEVISQRVPTSRCASLLWSPLHYPVVGSKSSSHSLKK